MISYRFATIVLASSLSLTAAHADLASGLLAYYDFEETGPAGLANKAPGATDYQGIRVGTLYPDWATGDNATGPGFSGNAAFASSGASGTSDRSAQRVGHALNLDDDRNESVQIPLGTAQLGNSFSVAAWHYLAPGALNASTRYQLFESSGNFDISWGTSNTGFTTPQPAYQYLAYVGEGPAGGFGPTGISTNEWHHVVQSVSSDGTTTTMKLYVDGAFFGSRTVPTASVDFPAVNLGRQRSSEGSDREWDGMTDEVAFWNRALTRSEVFEAYRRGQEGIPLIADLATRGKAFVSVESADTTKGQAYGSDLYNIGDVASISAVATIGRVLTGWTSDFAGNPDSFDLNVTHSVTSVASFADDTADNDGDGLTNYQELAVYFTDPDNADTDEDLINDGNEVNTTHTSPNISQLAAVEYIRANLSTGGVQPGDTVLTRNTIDSSLTFHLSWQTSTGLTGFGALPAGASAAANVGAFRLQLPATADPKRFYRGLVTAP